MKAPNTDGQSDDPVDDLAEEFARRWRAGEEPSVEEYVARHPERADEVRDVLSAVVIMEQLKPRREDALTLAEPGPHSARVPERIGDFCIVREIGRGGMGVVYEAVQEALGRRVALKLLPASSFANEKFRARFRRESQAAARLHHTNIVPVFGVGEHDGVWFYVMQLIDGQGLDKVVREAGWANAATVPLSPKSQKSGVGGQESDIQTEGTRRLTPATVAHIGVQVADALAYAHEQGVLHRDIKPSNLILDEHGIVWVTDFGVAKLLEDTNLTHSGDLVGTLKYMPPERFQGESDARSDVYSLGLTLYELLARRPAYADTTPQQIIQIITHNDPTPLRTVAPTVPADLETIILKAAARDPAHRYQTASALADDLRRFLDDRPIIARRTTRTEQAWRWCRRNPALATATAIAFVLMLTTTIVSVIASVTTEAASRSVLAANHDMEKALAAETAQKEQAELTSTLALDALNGIYNRFAPTRLVVTPPASDENEVDVPLQPALPPEAIPLLEELLRTYERLAKSGGEFPKLQAQAAEANYRIGNIRQRLGRLEEAAVAYRAAINLYDRLLPDAVDDPVHIKLSRACGELGRTLRLSQQSDEAGRMHDRAILTMMAAPKDLASRPEYRYELARALFASDQREPQTSAAPPMGPPRGGPKGKASPFGEPKRGPRGKGPPKDKWRDGAPPPNGKGKGEPPRRFLPDADRPLHRAADILEKLVSDYPSVPEYRHLLACCYRNMPPDPFEDRPPHESAERAMVLLRQLVKDFPKVPDYRFDLCATLARRGPPDPGRPGPPEVPSPARRQRLEEAVALSAPLVADYPNVPDYAAAHARYLDDLGISTFLGGKPAEAEQFMRQAVALEQKLVKQYPDVLAYDVWLAVMERSLGHVLAERGDWTEARNRLQSSVDRLEALRKNDAGRRVPAFDRAVRDFLGVAYRDLIRALTGVGETGLADAARQKAGGYDLDRGPDPFRGPPGGRR
jgi:serine/threonine protein kinase